MPEQLPAPMGININVYSANYKDKQFRYFQRNQRQIEVQSIISALTVSITI
jgi:hypothetical protein